MSAGHSVRDVLLLHTVSHSLVQNNAMVVGCRGKGDTWPICRKSIFVSPLPFHNACVCRCLSYVKRLSYLCCWSRSRYWRKLCKLSGVSSNHTSCVAHMVGATRMPRGMRCIFHVNAARFVLENIGVLARGTILFYGAWLVVVSVALCGTPRPPFFSLHASGV